MTRHDPAVTFRQMLDYSRRAVEFSRSRSRDDLARDDAFFLAMTRALEIIGEGATRLSDDVRQRYPEVDWTGLIGLRNRLAHAYDLLDADLLWRAIQEDVPQLIGQPEALLPDWPLESDD